MSTQLHRTFDKKLIGALPQAVFPGRTIVILSPGETEKAVDYLLSQRILGIDTETRPSFHKGNHYKVSLLQVSTHDTCFLFRLNHTGMTPALIRFLEDTTVLKVGLSLHDDIHALHQRAEFKAGWFVDLQDHVKEVGVEDLSLQKLYANFFGQRISKRSQLTNWEADVLTDRQKQYAATDAWACIMLYEELQRLKESGDYTLIDSEKSETQCAGD